MNFQSLWNDNPNLETSKAGRPIHWVSKTTHRYTLTMTGKKFKDYCLEAYAETRD